MEFIDKQIAPPANWDKFEDLMRSLFAAIWKDPLAQRNGRSGFPQHGVDIFGSPPSAGGLYHGVQCKGKTANYGAKATSAEFDAELTKAEAFRPRLSHWTFATTASNDPDLQEHARMVSAARVENGLFPVTAIGWQTITGLLSHHIEVAEEFYREHVGDLPKLLAKIRALPDAADLRKFQELLVGVSADSARAADRVSPWAALEFGAPRDLRAALMGRALGPADVEACPPLPEVDALLGDLRAAGSARLAGVAGAGKSICLLQVAKRVHDRGWRVLRLTDSERAATELESHETPTLYLIDNAHLLLASALEHLEEKADDKRWVLSAHTLSQARDSGPGTIQLDAKRAVKVIAEGLRANPQATLAAVRKIDDRVGDQPHTEPLERRLVEAEVADFPWQFCFILGGGWRRAEVIASSARAAGAELVFSAAAIRQLATRDAICSPEQLRDLLGDSVEEGVFGSACAWLVKQRLFVASDDLRLPHQRLAGVLLDRILIGLEKERREVIADLLRRTLADPAMPMAGLALLLADLQRGGDFVRFSRIVEEEWLDPLLRRCWQASTAIEIRHAAWILGEIYQYRSDEMEILSAAADVIATWLEAAPQGACYPLGRVANHILNGDPELAGDILSRIDPVKMAGSIGRAHPVHACEIADLLQMMRVMDHPFWRDAYLAAIDRGACLAIMSKWSLDSHLWAAADFCEHFCSLDFAFGAELIQALIPAIRERMRAEPQDSFDQLHDIFWNSLRLYDPLQIYVGRRAPSRKMKQVGRALCACWRPAELAAKLSASNMRSFQAAAGLMSMLPKVSAKQFDATVLAIDWTVIDATIGDGWTGDLGYASQFIGQCYASRAARPLIESLIASHASEFDRLDPYLAYMAPETALAHLVAGRPIGLATDHLVEWEITAIIAARIFKIAPSLLPRLLDPHVPAFAKMLSSKTPSDYHEALLFLRLLPQLAPNMMKSVLAQIDPEIASIGWRNALRGEFTFGDRAAKREARRIVALLIHHVRNNEDALGDLARDLLREFPKLAAVEPALLEAVDIRTVLAS